MGTGGIFSVEGFPSELSGLTSVSVVLLFFFSYLERFNVVSWISFRVL